MIIVPATSDLLNADNFVKLLNLDGVHKITLDQCQFNDGKYKKPTSILTNVPSDYTRQLLNCKCTCAKSHTEPLNTPARVKAAENFPPKLAHTIAAIVTNVIMGNQPMLSDDLETHLLNAYMTTAHHTLPSKTILDTGCTHSMLNTQDWRPMNFSSQMMDITVQGGKTYKMPIGSAAIVVTDSNNKPNVLVAHQVCLCTGSHANLIDPYQIENQGWQSTHHVSVNNRTPHISLNDIQIPLSTSGGVHLKGRFPTDHDMRTLTSHTLTADIPWSNARYIKHITTGTDFFNTKAYRTTITPSLIPADIFFFMTDNTRRLTSMATTRLDRTDWRDDLSRRYKRNPALRNRINEKISHDTLFASSASRDGHKMVQVIVCHKSKHITIVPMKAKSMVPHALQTFMTEIGIPTAIKSDNAKENTSKQIKELCRNLYIQLQTSEAHRQYQNLAERYIGYLKRTTMTVLQHTGAPPTEWYSCMQYVTWVHNRTARPNLNCRTPIEVLTGGTPDISSLCEFPFWQRLSVHNPDQQIEFPTSSITGGHYLGPATNAGSTNCHLILMDNGNQQAKSVAMKETPSLHSSKERGNSPAVQFHSENEHHPTPDNDEEFLAKNEEETDNVLVDDPGVQDFDIDDATGEPVNTLEDSFGQTDYEIEGKTSDYTESTSFQSPSTTTDSQLENQVELPKEEEHVFQRRNMLSKTVYMNVDETMILATVVNDKFNSGERQIELSLEGDHQNRTISHDEFLILTNLHRDAMKDEDVLWSVEKIGGFRNCKNNLDLQVLWSDGSKTWEPFDNLCEDSPKELADYAIETFSEYKSKSKES